MNTKQLITRFGLVLLTVLVFTFFDWLVHANVPSLSVPSWYFRNKIIFGTIIAFATSLVLRKQTILRQSLIVSLITVVLLELRYAFLGYAWWFHAIVLPEHFIFLTLTLYAALKIEKHFYSKQI